MQILFSKYSVIYHFSIHILVELLGFNDVCLKDMQKKEEIHNYFSLSRLPKSKYLFTLQM